MALVRLISAALVLVGVGLTIHGTSQPGVGVALILVFAAIVPLTYHLDRRDKGN